MAFHAEVLAPGRRAARVRTEAGTITGPLAQIELRHAILTEATFERLVRHWERPGSVDERRWYAGVDDLAPPHVGVNYVGGQRLSELVALPDPESTTKEPSILMVSIGRSRR